MFVVVYISVVSHMDSITLNCQVMMLAYFTC